MYPYFCFFGEDLSCEKPLACSDISVWLADRSLSVQLPLADLASALSAATACGQWVQVATLLLLVDFHLLLTLQHDTIQHQQDCFSTNTNIFIY